VRPFVWISPSTLFIANTATPEEGNSAAPMLAMQHFATLYDAGSFQIDPDYVKERVVGLNCDVAETYVPVEISVAYGGQMPVPKPFLTILEWIHAPEGWRMATKIAPSIPPASHC
jgi:hypothetical protein